MTRTSFTDDKNHERIVDICGDNKMMLKDAIKVDEKHYKNIGGHLD
jgi:hypothetical protein